LLASATLLIQTCLRRQGQARPAGRV